jgi:hypothetical protein
MHARGNTQHLPVLGFWATMEDRLPEEFHCPITHEIMKDPVIAIDGHSYERSAIQEWFRRGQETSPRTNDPLQSQQLYPNHALRNVIEKYDDERSILRAELMNIRQAIRREIAAGEKMISIINALDIGDSPPSSETIDLVRKRKRDEEDDSRRVVDQEEKEAEVIVTDNSIIEMAISDQRNSLNFRKRTLSEMLQRNKEEGTMMLREQVALSQELNDNRDEIQFEEREKKYQENLASLREKLSTFVKHRINLETISPAGSEPNLQTLLDGYGTLETKCKSDIETLDQEYRESILPLKDEAILKRIQIRERLTEIDASYPVVVLTGESLQSQFNECAKETEDLNEIKSDLSDALQWAKQATNRMYSPSVHSLPSLLLSFKLHARLELQSGKGKPQLLAKGFSPKRLKRFGVSLREMMGTSAGFSLRDLKEGGYTILEMNQEGISLQELANLEETNPLHAPHAPFPSLKRPSYDLKREETDIDEEEEHVGLVVSQESCTPATVPPPPPPPTIVTTKHSSSSSSIRTSSSSARGPHPLTMISLRCRRINDGFTATEARKAGYHLSHFKDAGYRPRDLFLAGYSDNEMKEAKFSLRAIIGSQKSAKQHRDDGCSAIDLHRDHYPIQELYQAGFSYDELEIAGYSVEELVSIGRSPDEPWKYHRSVRLAEAGILTKAAVGEEEDNHSDR